jgi:hypothetical protein
MPLCSPPMAPMLTWSDSVAPSAGVIDVAPTVVPFTGDEGGALAPNGLAVDRADHLIFVSQYADHAADYPKAGIFEYSYDLTTGAMTNNGFIFPDAQSHGTSAELGIMVFDPANDTRYFQDEGFGTNSDGSDSENELYAYNVSTNAVTTMLTQSDFPARNSTSSFPNGFINGVAVDPSRNLAYFATQNIAFSSTRTAQDAVYSVSTSGGTATEVTGRVLVPDTPTFSQ